MSDVCVCFEEDVVGGITLKDYIQISRGARNTALAHGNLGLGGLDLLMGCVFY